MKTVNELIKDINSLTSHLHEKDFLLTWEQTPDELKQVLDVAAALKALRAENISTKVFNSGLGISVFRDNSTRTRFSYASALNLLGLAQQDLDEGKSQIAHGETVRETANMISFCADAIGIRDDMYLGAGNAYMREVGAALDDGYKQGVLPQRPALVNLQCDIDHPTQSMADLAWLREHFGSLENLKGKKIAMTWAYSPSYGKPLSVPQGIIGLMTRFGMDVTLAHPEGYDLIPDVVEVAKNNAKASSVATNRQAALFAAFPHHPHFTRLQVEVFDIEPHQFGKTQTRAVHHFQHCPIAHGEGIVDINIQQPIHIIDVDVFRQMTRRFRCRNTFRRVGFELVLADQPVKKAT